MFTVTQEFKFDAAHNLGDDYLGKCKSLHGHTYKVQVTVSLKDGESLDEYGMVVDFGKIKEIWKKELEPMFDHKYLNETLDFITTGENIVKFLFDKFSEYLNSDRINVYKVELWETPTSKTTYQL